VHSLLTFPGQPVDIINVYLDPLYHPLPTLPPELAGVLPEIVPLHAFLGHALNRVVRLRLPDPGAVRARLETVERELRERPPGYEEAARMLVRLFLMDCCREALASGIGPGAGPAPPSAGRLDAVRRRLETDFASAPTRGGLARLAGVAPEHLCRAFKAYTGSTVVGYLLQRRLQHAMLRLRGSDDKILAIALECGFRDLSYFNRQFKARVGMTPTRYRRPAGPGAEAGSGRNE
jgi:AraC-like DNA-binding protein